MDAYFDFSRDRGVILGRPHVEIVGGVFYEYEFSFDRKIERLMLHVICMVLSGGWYREPMNYHREQIKEIFANDTLQNLLADIPQEEAALFQHDLKILQLI